MTTWAFVIVSLLLQVQVAAPLPPDTYFLVELKKEITSMRSKPGQELKLVVAEDVKTADGTVLLPAGAKLHGTISVAHKRNGSEPSALAIAIDKAEWKDIDMPLNASLERLEAIGATADSFCGPNLNRAGMTGACGGSTPTLSRPPADCTMAKVGDAMAITCSKHEVELGNGSMLVFKNAAPKS